MHVLSWLLQRLASRYDAKAKNLNAYEEGYKDALDTVLSFLEEGRRPDLNRLQKLRPVFFDKPDWVGRDLVSGQADQAFQADLRPFVNTQRDTRDKGIWHGYTVLQTIQSTCWPRMIKQTQKIALQEIVLSNQPAEAPAIGPISMYGLIGLNNMLCLYARMRSSKLSNVPVLGPFMIKYDLRNKALQNAIHTVFVRMTTQPYTTGDLFFMHSLIQLVFGFQQDHLVVPYFRRLIHMSPWTVLGRIDDDEIWRTISSEDLASVSRIFSMRDHGLPVSDTLMQRWVDALVLAGEDRRGLIFERINMMMTHLLDPSNTQGPQDDMEKRHTNLRCILIFIRLLLRSWPDDQTKNETFGLAEKREEKKTAFWRVGFAQVAAWLDEARQGVDEVVWRPWLPLPEEHILRQCIILTERNV